MKSISLLPVVLLSLFFAACATQQPLTTVSHVNLKRYSGEWYEIAKNPNWFERHCAANASAKYTVEPDGSIRVLNTCLCKNGKPSHVEGRATIVPGSENAKLKVRLLGPLTGNYWIIGLDEKNYQWALVGEPSRRYLWILARQPFISNTLYEHILSVAKAKGYDTSLLQRTIQDGHCGCR